MREGERKKKFKKKEKKDKRKQGKPKSLYPLPQRINTGRIDTQQDETKPIYNGKNSVGIKEDKNRE